MGGLPRASNRGLKSMIRYYKLSGKTPLLCESQKEWVEWFTTANRVVDFDKIGDVHVSTVFIGFGWKYVINPLLFETMIFGGKRDGYRVLSRTWEDAEREHVIAVTLVNVGENNE